MKIFLAVSKRYARTVIDVISSITPRPYVFVVSYDDEVEVLSKTQGYEYAKINDIEKLYTFEKLEEFDVAIAALDDDALNTAIVRVAKSMGIPVTILIIHNNRNKDIALREGAQSIIDLENFISGNLKLLLLPDTWILMEIIPMAKVVAAIHRVVKRSILGVGLKILRESVESSDVQIFGVDAIGNFIGEEKPLENGDILIVIGVEDRVLNAITRLEKTFRRYEQLHVARYPEIHRPGGYG